MDIVRRNVTFANIVSVIALLVALSGTAYALSVGSDDIVNDSVRSIDIKDYTIRNNDIRNGAVRANSIMDGSVQEDDITAVAKQSIGGIWAKVNNSGTTIQKSSGWGASSVTRIADGRWCINVLTLGSVQNVQATVVWGESGYLLNAQATTDAAAGGCPAGSDAYVETFDVTSGVRSDASFYVHLMGSNL